MILRQPCSTRSFSVHEQGRVGRTIQLTGQLSRYSAGLKARFTTLFIVPPVRMQDAKIDDVAGQQVCRWSGCWGDDVITHSLTLMGVTSSPPPSSLVCIDEPPQHAVLHRILCTAHPRPSTTPHTQATQAQAVHATMSKKFINQPGNIVPEILEV